MHFFYIKEKKKGFKRKKWEKVFKILFGNSCHLLMSVSIPSFLPPLPTPEADLPPVLSTGLVLCLPCPMQDAASTGKACLESRV